MTIAYSAKYAHNDNDTPGTLTLKATSDAAAVQEIRDFVRGGFRNSTWANLELSNGRIYRVANVHGESKGGYV